VKVVLFCGGRGLRLREYSEAIPKPMITVGFRPVLWHVMRYFAHFGHREFILCLGYKADVIKEYFLRYNEALSNDFVLSNGGRDVELLQRDIQDWRISFIDTGLSPRVGERLRAVRRFVDDAPFLANYGDVLTDAPLNERVDRFLGGSAVGSFLCVRPRTYSFHLVRLETDHRVAAIEDIGQSNLWINGGYFIFRPELFDYLGPGEELVEQPFRRLIEAGKLHGDPYDGFWAPMDTLKDLQLLESVFETGRPPWAVWMPSEGKVGEAG
jgi:glucose-1-phosphate cytidylyltransferase